VLLPPPFRICARDPPSSSAETSSLIFFPTQACFFGRPLRRAFPPGLVNSRPLSEFSLCLPPPLICRVAADLPPSFNLFALSAIVPALLQPALLFYRGLPPLTSPQYPVCRVAVMTSPFLTFSMFFSRWFYCSFRRPPGLCPHLRFFSQRTNFSFLFDVCPVLDLLLPSFNAISLAHLSSSVECPRTSSRKDGAYSISSSRSWADLSFFFSPLTLSALPRCYIGKQFLFSASARTRLPLPPFFSPQGNPAPDCSHRSVCLLSPPLFRN